MPSLDPNSSYPNMDQIVITSTGIQKLCAFTYSLNQLNPVLAQLFQQSLDQGMLPDDWRNANVGPVLKKGRRSLAGNYRPISLTSITCKVQSMPVATISGNTQKTIVYSQTSSTVSVNEEIVKPKLQSHCRIQWMQ